MKKMLVVYYSWSNGNTKRIAEQLTNGTGADIARIETTEPYSGSHEDVVEQGKREVEAGFMPRINPISVNLADYDVIAIGTPTWWYTMAPAVLTFLTVNDFTGKTVIPFMTADNGHDIIKILSDAGIKASVIGRTTADHNKILRNDDEVRYLDTPNRDEVYRFI